MAGRPRKPLEQQKGHLTTNIKEQKEKEEELVTVGNDQLKKTPSTLIDKVAKKEYKRIVQEYEKIKIVGNLDLQTLVGYCNAFSMYIKATNELKDQPLVITRSLVRDGETIVENPLIKIQNKYADEMRKFGAMIGMNVNNRLKSSTEILNKQDENVKNKFGI